MKYLQVLPAKFNSNIYTYREILSDWLSTNVMYRLTIDEYLCSPDDIEYLDSLLKKHHYLFIKIIKSIDTLEKDTYVFGS